MKFLKPILSCAAATLLAAHAIVTPVQAGEAELNALFEELRKPGLSDWKKVERDIWEEWSRSGSDAMDLLLNRGRKAMQERDFAKAVEHFSAIIDHSPDFAEAWNARATAFFAWDRYGMSIRDIQQTLALNPRHFGALQGLGRILEELEDYDNALKAFQAAFAIHPHRPDLKANIERLEAKVSGQDI